MVSQYYSIIIQLLSVLLINTIPIIICNYPLILSGMEIIPLGLQPVNGQSIYLVKINNKYILLDAGNAQFTKLNLSPLKNIELTTCLVSHYHKDHTGAIPQLKSTYPNLNFYQTKFRSQFNFPLHGKIENFHFIPSGHVNGSVAIASKNLFYTGDYQTTRTVSHRGLSDFTHSDFLLTESSQIGLIKGSLSLKLAFLGYFKPDEFYDLSSNFNLRSAQYMKNDFQRADCTFQNKNFRQILQQNLPRFQENKHADYKDICMSIDAVMPKCVILTHCSNVADLISGVEKMRKMVQIEVDWIDQKVVQMQKVKKNENVVRRVRREGTLKKFLKKMEKKGVLMEQGDGYYFCGRNVVYQVGEEIILCYSDELEGEVFLKYFAKEEVKKVQVDDMDGFWD